MNFHTNSTANAVLPITKEEKMNKEIEELQAFYEAHGWDSQEAWSQATIDIEGE